MNKILYTLIILGSYLAMTFNANAQTCPLSCDYEFAAMDSWGDGWNGATVEVATSLCTQSLTFDTGAAMNWDISVINGETVTVTETAAGDWAGEVSYTITGPTGDIPVNVAGGTFAGNSSFSFVAICEENCPLPPINGTATYAFDGADSWGDGWNGFSLDWTSTANTATDAGGAACVYASEALTFTAGTNAALTATVPLFEDATITWGTTSGAWDNEVSWTITGSPNPADIGLAGTPAAPALPGAFASPAAEPAPDAPIANAGLFCIGKSEPLQPLSVIAPTCANGFTCPDVDCSAGTPNTAGTGLVGFPAGFAFNTTGVEFLASTAVAIPGNPNPATMVPLCAEITVCAMADHGTAALGETLNFDITFADGSTALATVVGEGVQDDCALLCSTIAIDLATVAAGGDVTVVGTTAGGGVNDICGNTWSSMDVTVTYGAAPTPNQACINWYLDECSTVPFATGTTLTIDAINAAIAADPCLAGGVDLENEGTITFFAAANCGNTESVRVPVSLVVFDCECNEGCPYFLVMNDAGSNGWDGASLDVSIAEAWPATNYKVTGTSHAVKLCVGDGETIDMTYWNGAFEDEHSYVLMDSYGNIVYNSGNSPQANTLNRVKAECPDIPCIGGTEDFTVRITMGNFPEEQSWEIYEGPSSTTAQGTQIIGINATTYTGLAPGFEVDYAVTLDQCQIYTFVGFDGFNDSWNSGTWDLITANLNYGNEILNPFDSHYGESLVLGPIAPTADELRTEFTIPCEPACTAENVVNASTATCASVDPIDLPVEGPIVCYPYCQHAEGCDLTVKHTVLAEGLNGAVFFGAAYFEIEGTEVPFNGQTELTWDGDAGFGVGVLPVGCHKYVTEYTYCDNVIAKCTADLNIVTDPNPSMTCNDNVIISLGAPSSPNGEFTLGECIVRVTPDMVMEAPASDCFGIFEEYKVTVLGEDGQPLVQLGPNGLPLDVAGNEIPTGIVDREPANNFIGPAQEWQTLTYVVEHKFSGNKCWGTLTVEDKLDPVINCVDYDLNCTHPNALDEFHTHTDVYTVATELPANIAGGNAGLQSNTFIPVNLPCAPMGEIIQDIRVNLNLTHNDVTDLSVILHPTAEVNAFLLNINPMYPGFIQLDTNGDVGPSNIYTPNPANDAPGLLQLLGVPCTLTESTSPETFVTENSGNQVPANAGGTWYIQIIDNNATFPTPPFGGGQITAASMTLTCGFPFPYAAFDCTLDNVQLIDEQIVETNCDQSDWNGSVIERVWQASDKNGRTSTCKQTVSLKAPTMDQIEKPGDIAIECTGQTADEITPEVSGGPIFGCFELTQDLHGLCDISYAYEDQVLNTCGEGYKIIRDWTIINWCTGVNKHHQQIIKVEDTEGPSIGQDDVVTVGTDPYDCSASVSLDDLGIEDNCSGVGTVTATYTQGGGAYIGGGTLVIVNLATSSLENLPMGSHEILITAKDLCLNETEKLITINIVDNTPPVPICDDQLHVSLGGDGTARLNAEDVDEGSYDNCSDVTLEVRRTDGCLGTSAWASYVAFECCDVDELVTVELRVTDAAGNTNVCWKRALIEDALPPVITCPADKTLNCDDPTIFNNPFGEAVAIDNCNASVTETDGGELDQCKAGTLTRTWTATDGSDKSGDASCTQRVTVLHVSDFTVQFPADATISTCPDDLGATGEPQTSDVDCELLGITHDDVVLTIADNACYTIERTWTVVNLCVYDQGNPANTDLGFPQPLPRTYQDDGDGYFTYVQLIEVIDNDAPTVDNPGTIEFCDLTEGCEGQADLMVFPSDECSNFEDLVYSYQIDANNDGSFDIIDSGNDASGIYPYGTHLIKWSIEDGCGNVTEMSHLFIVKDCKNPTPVCLNGISLPGMNSDGCVELWANDLLEYAFDNCSSDEFVEGSVKIRREGDTSAPQSALTLCCDTDGVGTVILEVWVEDEAGNADYCTTYAILQDPNNICGDSDDGDDDDSRMIAGDITTEQDETVNDVMVNVAGSNGVNTALPTGDNGQYAFPMAQGADYTVTPTKDHGPLNGVSTYDLVLMSQHILGVNELTTPYQLIAADVNNDGNVTTFDVVQNRQLILYVITDFPTNTSWRFVDASYVFPVANNPWFEAFPEAIDVANLTQDEMTVDFMAVKVGDINGDATPNSLVGADDRNMNGTLVLNIDDATAQAGTTTSIDFRASDFDGINGYQFTMNFDATAMNFAGVEAGALNVSEGNFGLSMLNEGVITTSWNTSEATKVANDEVLFTLNFNVTNNVVLSEAVSVSSRYTAAEAYAGTDLMDVALAFNGQVVAGTNFELLQNTPNPFNGETLIGFNLPTAATATLKVYDVAGKVLKVIENDYAKGYNQISLNSNDLNATGVLYYQLDTDTNSATMKMIIIE